MKQEPAVSSHIRDKHCPQHTHLVTLDGTYLTSVSTAQSSTAMGLNVYTVLVCLLYFGVVLSYRPYPISGSWFKNRNNATELNSTLKQYKSIGGDTVFLTGAEYKIRQPDDIRRDPDFKDCVIGKEDCVHTCLSMLLKIIFWLRLFKTLFRKSKMLSTMPYM